MKTNHGVPTAIARMTRYGNNWTILTYAKVLRGAFTREDIHKMNPEKYPLNSRSIRETLVALNKLGLIKKLEGDMFQITEKGINAVYWLGGHFARNPSRKSDLSD